MRVIREDVCSILHLALVPRLVKGIVVTLAEVGTSSTAEVGVSSLGANKDPGGARVGDNRVSGVSPRAGAYVKTGEGAAGQDAGHDLIAVSVAVRILAGWSLFNLLYSQL